MRIFTQIYLKLNKVTTPHPPQNGPPSPPNKGEGFSRCSHNDSGGLFKIQKQQSIKRLLLEEHFNVSITFHCRKAIAFSEGKLHIENIA